MSAPQETGRTLHVLLVDDQQFFLDFARDLLVPAGFQVSTASNGDAALEIAQSRGPDAILLDVEMPEMDGYETCRSLKRNPSTAHIPVVFLTSTLDPRIKERALAAGAAGAYVKAISPDRLRAILEETVRRGR